MILQKLYVFSETGCLWIPLTYNSLGSLCSPQGDVEMEALGPCGRCSIVEVAQGQGKRCWSAECEIIRCVGGEAVLNLVAATGCEVMRCPSTEHWWHIEAKQSLDSTLAPLKAVTLGLDADASWYQITFERVDFAEKSVVFWMSLGSLGIALQESCAFHIPSFDRF